MKHSKANISVIIATHNGSAFIEAQIQSILSQTLAAAEIIVCDDASTDDTIAIVQKWEEQGKLRLIRNTEALGVAENFKKGVALSDPANFIALADQDDVWLPYKLERCCERIEAFDDQSLPSLVYSDASLVDQQLQVINPSFQNELGIDKFEHCFETTLFGCPVLGCTTLFNPALRREFVQQSFSKTYLHDAWLALIAHGWGNCACIKEPLMLYRQHQNNLTIANHRKIARHSKLLAHTKAFFNDSNYLMNELEIAMDFSSCYFDKLSSSKQFAINSFLSLQTKSYFQKKWAFEKTFFPHWLNRFSK
jgi:rhamnosyltransferase